MEQLNNMTIGKKIMSLRKEAGLTQEQLAEKLGISPQAVSKWENGISCPDISMLPTLASLFHVTVDDLLGVERPSRPIEDEATSMADNGTQAEDANEERYAGASADAEGTQRNGNWHGLGFAFLLIGLGVTFLLCRYFGLTPNVWDIVWPAVIFGLGVAWFVREIAPIGLGVAFVGFYYLLRNIGQPLPFALEWDLIWPVGLVLLGLGALIDSFRWKNRWHQRWLHQNRNEEAMEYSENDGSLYMRTIFGEGNRRVRAEKLTGGKVEYIFSGGELDLTGVKTLGNDGFATIHTNVVFAGCDIILPPHIRLYNKANCALGGIDIKGNPTNPTSVLTLTGDVVFGGIDIRYVG